MNTIDMSQPQMPGTATPPPKKRGCLLGCLGILAVFILIIVSIAGSFIGIHNRLIDQREEVRSSFSTIDAQLQRRIDLIPNLVNVTKGYAKHEKEVFTAVSEARSKLLAAQTVTEKAEASTAVNSALGRLMAISENYPQLKANENFIRLQDELAGTENRIAVARTRYNEHVKTFNAAIMKFPARYFAIFLQMEPAPYFKPSVSQKELEKSPVVSFD